MDKLSFTTTTAHTQMASGAQTFSFYDSRACFVCLANRLSQCK